MNMVLVNYVSYYATQVRGFMRGLSPEVIDELTGGLEADLIEATADSEIVAKNADVTLADLVERFGTPESYAKELCESAGVEIPAPGLEQESAAQASNSGKKQKTRVTARVRSRLAHWWAALDAVDVNPAVRKFLIDVRPVWWFLRAWVFYAILVSFENVSTHRPFPKDLAHWLMLSVLFVISVLIGRTAHAKNLTSGWRKTAIVANVVLALFVPMAMSQASSSEADRAWHEGYASGREDESVSYDSSSTQPQPNLPLVGAAGATNLYVYDSQGAFVPDARIVSESGAPIDSTIYPVKVDQALMTISLLNVRVDEFGREALNVFPASFATIDVAKDSCTPADQEFWEDLLVGDVSEDWPVDDSGEVAPGSSGLLQVADRKAQFKYGSNSLELFVGGESTLTSSADCLYGFNRSALEGSAAPQIVSLPALAASELSPEESEQEAQSDAKDLDVETAKPDSQLIKDIESELKAAKKALSQAQEGDDAQAVTDAQSMVKQLTEDLKKAKS